MKRCPICEKEKELSDFKHRKTSLGYTTKVCIECSEKRKKVRDSSRVKEYHDLTMKRDYCIAYQLLTSLGYDINSDIHAQFVQRHNLEYKNKPKSNKLKYLPRDCQ